MIITTIPTAAHVKDVYLGDNDPLVNVTNSILLTDSSSIVALTAWEVVVVAAKNGNLMIDAPVVRRR